MSNRNQFSLLHALALMTAVAFLTGVAVMPEPLRALIAQLLHTSLLTVAVAAIIFGRGLVRAFWIGWIVPMTTVHFTFIEIYRFPDESVILLLLIVFNAFCGALSWGTARWLMASSPEPESRTPPPFG